MGFDFGGVDNAVFEHKKFSIDEFYLIFDLVYLSVHELIDILESGDFFLFLSFFGFC